MVKKIRLKLRRRRSGDEYRRSGYVFFRRQEKEGWSSRFPKKVYLKVDSPMTPEEPADPSLATWKEKRPTPRGARGERSGKERRPNRKERESEARGPGRRTEEEARRKSERAGTGPDRRGYFLSGEETGAGELSVLCSALPAEVRKR